MVPIFSNQAFEVFKVKNFSYYLSCRFFMTLALLMQSVVVGWQVYKLTNDVLMLGYIGLAEFIAQVTVSLFAGHFIDLWNRKKIVAYATLILIIASGILYIYSLPNLNCYIKYGIFPIFLTIILTGVARGILMPAQSALFGQIMPREKLTSAATWNTTSWHVGSVIGPAIGGLIYGFYNEETVYLTIIIFQVISFLTVLKISNIATIPVKNKEENIFTRIAYGFKFVFKNQVLLSALTLDMFAVLFGGAIAVLPVFASTILHIGPQGLGILRACPAVGAIIMSIYLTIKPPVNKSGQFLFVSVALFGVCMIGFALSTNVLLSGLCLLLSGAFDNVSMVIRGTIVQLFTPNDMRGRVAAVNSIFIGSSNELGSFESGITARFMGLIPSVILGGIMTLAVVVTTAKASPQLRKLSLKNH